ncbi:MAG: RNA polymerase sigma factor, partial [Actinomycetota bacterium]|nr:RNA polymerase sigma factor [Actinomycetota bacterium]
MRGRTARVEELYDAHMPAAVRFAYLVSGDAELAQDLAHDAFLRVSSRLGALRSPEAFRAY